MYIYIIYISYSFKSLWNLRFKYLLANIRQVFLRKVDNLGGGLVAYIYRPENHVVGHVVIRPRVAIDGRCQYVQLVPAGIILAVEGVQHGHGQSIPLVLPAVRDVKRRPAVYTFSFLFVGFLRRHLGHFSVGCDLDSNNHLL